MSQDALRSHWVKNACLPIGRLRSPHFATFACAGSSLRRRRSHANGHAGRQEAGMFLRRYTRTKDGKAHTYFALVESNRTDAGPRQRIVAYLGELNQDQERRWQRTVVFYNRHGDAQQLRLFPDDDEAPLPDDPDVVRVRLKNVGWTNARSFGDVRLARWLWHHIGLDEIVARHLPQGKEEVRPADVV